MTRYTHEARRDICYIACSGIPTGQLHPGSVKVLVETLDRIATWSDTGAQTHLERTGSYGQFDEPGSAQMARDALGQFRGDKNPKK